MTGNQIIGLSGMAGDKFIYHFKGDDAIPVTAEDAEQDAFGFAHLSRGNRPVPKLLACHPTFD
jgi:hypothetical protein